MRYGSVFVSGLCSSFEFKVRTEELMRDREVGNARANNRPKQGLVTCEGA